MTQISGAIALAVIGLLLLLISAISRDGFSSEISPFANRLSKAGIFLGATFILPLVLMLLSGIIAGFHQ